MLAEVKSVKTTGVLLTILDGQQKGEEAWLPREQWSDNAREWEEAYESLESGQELDVVKWTGEEGPNGEPAVSRKLFDITNVDTSWVEDTRIMEVESLSRTLIRGHIDKIPAVMKQEKYMEFLASRKAGERLMDHAALAKGDILGGYVTATEGEHKAVELDPFQYFEMRENEISGHFDQARELDDAQSTDAVHDRPPSLSPETAAKITPVLLVEDNDRYREYIRALLTTGGAEVETVQNLAEATEHVDSSHQGRAGQPTDEGKRSFRLAIIDPNLLPEAVDLSGMPIIQALQSLPQCKILLITGEPDHRAKLKRWGDLKVHGFLPKPFTTEHLLLAIDEALALDPPIELREWIQEELDDAEQESQSTQKETAEEYVETGQHSETMNSVLRELEAKKPGSTIHVFELHSRSFRASSLANVGDGLQWRPFRGKIGKSRIKDVALSHKPICENVVSRFGTHLWTQRMMKYQSFCGIPIKIPFARRHALVVFHPDGDAFDETFQLQALLCAERVARLLERNRFRRDRETELSFAAVGMALGALSHELHNDLMSIEGDANQLHRLLHGEEALPPEDRRQANQKTVYMRSSITDAIGRSNALRGVRGATETVSVAYCLRRAARACRNVLRDVVTHAEDIQIDLPTEEEDWQIKAVPAAPIIVLFNLYLNAVQQIDLMWGIRKCGRVWHSWERREDESGKPWAIVRIHDTGPGIHPDDWERIFEPGYTTKPDGMGFGLHICRHLLGSISESGRQASVKVTRSVLWDGTTFTVKLPLS